MALNYPGWQEKYIDILREAFDRVTLKVDDKAVNSKVEKSETKRAMPFIQAVKKRLAVETPETVFNRKLAFNEVETLKEAIPTIMKLTKAKVINIVTVDEDGKTGKDLDGKTVENLPLTAEGAEPGNPKFEFTNIE